MYSQLSGSTQPEERPVTACADDVLSTGQKSVMVHATEDSRESSKVALFVAPCGLGGVVE